MNEKGSYIKIKIEEYNKPDEYIAYLEIGKESEKKVIYSTDFTFYSDDWSLKQNLRNILNAYKIASRQDETYLITLPYIVRVLQYFDIYNFYIKYMPDYTLKIEYDGNMIQEFITKGPYNYKLDAVKGCLNALKYIDKLKYDIQSIRDPKRLVIIEIARLIITMELIVPDKANKTQSEKLNQVEQKW